MATKKIKKIQPVDIDEDEDVILTSLMDRYWNLIKTEEIGKTSGVTKAIDKLEEVINKHKKDKLTEDQSD
jgi:hypothetical protein